MPRGYRQAATAATMESGEKPGREQEPTHVVTEEPDADRPNGGTIMFSVHPLYRISQHPVSLPDDPRGRPVIDISGKRIGHVHDVIVEDRSVEEAGSLETRATLRFLEIGSGGRFHLGERLALLPVGEVVIEDRAVRVPADRFDLFGPDGGFTPALKTFSFDA